MVLLSENVTLSVETIDTDLDLASLAGHRFPVAGEHAGERGLPRP